MPWSHVSLDQNQVQRFFNHLNVVIVDSVVDITIGVDDFRESRSSDQDQDPNEATSGQSPMKWFSKKGRRDSIITKQGGGVVRRSTK